MLDIFSKDTLTRFLFGALLAAVIVSGMLLHSLVFTLLVTLIFLLMTWEYKQALSNLSISLRYAPAILSFIVLYVIFIRDLQSIGQRFVPDFGNSFLGYGSIVDSALLILTYLTVLAIVSRRDFPYLLMHFVWIALPSILMIDLFASTPSLLWIFLPVLTIISGDSFAYFVGRKFGKTKIFPAISPNKSLEGVLASLASGVLVATVFSLYFEMLEPLSAVILGFVMNMCTQSGDLIESAFKRKCGVKDTSSIIPGHGGVLDRFDSYLTTIPVYYLILMAWGFLA